VEREKQERFSLKIGKQGFMGISKHDKRKKTREEGDLFCWLRGEKENSERKRETKKGE